MNGTKSKLLRNLLPNYKVAKRKRSEIRRQYKANLEQIHEGEVEIIPYHDERLNYLERATQDTVIELNALIKSKGKHKGGDKYLLFDDGAIEEIERKMKWVVFITGSKDRVISYGVVSMIVWSLLIIIFVIISVMLQGNTYERLPEMLDSILSIIEL